MSAAATAAGYLYASGRLRGRGAKGEGESQPGHAEAKPGEKASARPRREVRVAVYAPEGRDRHDGDRQDRETQQKEKPRRVPKVQYRTRRWKPEAPNGE
jgi:hypothetical protein